MMNQKLTIGNAEDLFARGIKKISVTSWTAFISTILMAAIVNFPVYSQRLQGPDGMISDVISTWQWDFQLGRWMLPVDVFMRNSLTLSYYIFALAFILLGIISVLLCKMFSIRKPLGGLLIGLLIATFPSTASGMNLYNYIISYTMASLLGIVSVYILMQHKGKIPIFISAIALCIGMGYYQMSIVVAMSLCVLQLIRLLLSDNGSVRIALTMAGRMLIMGISGFSMYFAILLSLSKYLGIALALTEYSGADQFSLFTHIPKTYRTTLRFYASPTFFDNGDWGIQYAYCAILILGFIALVALIYHQAKKKKSVGIIICSLLLCMVLPIYLDFMEVMMADGNLSVVTAFPFLLPIIGSIGIMSLWVERAEPARISKEVVCQYLAIFAAFFLFNAFWKYDTAIFLGMEMAQNKAQSLAIRIVDDIEETEGYVPGMKILFCGTERPDLYPENFASLYETVDQSIGAMGLMWSNLGTAQTGWKGIIERTIGLQVDCVYDPVIYENILGSERYQTMPLFPMKDSIAIIDDIVVVKLNAAYDDIYKSAVN
ncbi:glucosyltransferase domain-containing protein [Oscillibacter sp. GMB15532]|uniref:glucosyltransferase domain-containing protein n=1 Tax=Oscillibacter sp. GMB15532 TaxID=3230022 RepID=UPI0034DE3811